MPRKSPQQPRQDTIPFRAGLYRDSDALPGTEAFLLYLRNGRRVGIWSAAEGQTDPALIEAFLDFLDRSEPRLMLVPSPSRRPV